MRNDCLTNKFGRIQSLLLSLSSSIIGEKLCLENPVQFHTLAAKWSISGVFWIIVRNWPFVVDFDQSFQFHLNNNDNYYPRIKCIYILQSTFAFLAVVVVVVVYEWKKPLEIAQGLLRNENLSRHSTDLALKVPHCKPILGRRLVQFSFKAFCSHNNAHSAAAAAAVCN